MVYNLLRARRHARKHFSLEDNKVKRVLAVFLAVLMLAALFSACGEKKAKTETAPETKGEEQKTEIPNPTTEYASLEEINEITHGRLAHPAVMGVTDEKFSVIDCGDYKIAQYDYSVNGIPYTFRFSDYVEDDISGIYEGGALLFGKEIAEEVKEFEGGKAARFFTTDGQYVLTAKDNGALELETFKGIADEQHRIVGDYGEAEGMAAQFVGDWHEQIAGRGMMTVTAENEKLHFSARWAGSYKDAYVWEFDGEVGADGKIEYKDGLRQLMEYDETGAATEKERKEDNSGVIWLDGEGNIVWQDNDSEGSEPAVFVRN